MAPPRRKSLIAEEYARWHFRAAGKQPVCRGPEMDLSLWKYTTVPDAGPGRVVLVNNIVCLTVAPPVAPGRSRLLLLSGERSGQVVTIGQEFCLAFVGQHVFEANAPALVNELDHSAPWEYVGQLILTPEGVFVAAITHQENPVFVGADGSITEDIAREKRRVRHWHLSLRDQEGKRVPFLDVSGRLAE